MSKKAARKIMEGLQSAGEHARVTTCIHDWIKYDCPTGVKMMLTPELVSALTDRLAGTRTTVI